MFFPKLQESETNDFDLMLFDKIIAYDHLREKMTVIVNMKTYDPERQHKQDPLVDEKCCNFPKSECKQRCTHFL